MTQYMPATWHKPIRLPDFDYASASTYFFTQCTHGRVQCLGSVEGDRMILSVIGEIVQGEWIKTLEIRKEIIEHAFIMMPNHVHGLVSIDANAIREPSVASHGNATPLHRKPRSLSTLVSGFKGAATRQVRLALEDPAFELWQKGYHEHIVRNEKSFETIYGYILNNPARWTEDRENPANADRS